MGRKSKGIRGFEGNVHVGEELDREGRDRSAKNAKGGARKWKHALERWDYLHLVSIAIGIAAMMPVKKRVEQAIERYFAERRLVF